MSYEDKYTNLRFRFFGGSRRELHLDEIHPDYILLGRDTGNKMHFVHRNEAEIPDHRPWLEGKGMCGRESKREENGERPKAKDICEECLSKMDKLLDRCFWDEKNEEYYDPAKEQ